MKQETIKMEEMRKQLSNLEVIGAVISLEVLGFWFGVGAALGAKMGPCGGLGAHRDLMVNNLENRISR